MLPYRYLLLGKTDICCWNQYKLHMTNCHMINALTLSLRNCLTSDSGTKSVHTRPEALHNSPTFKCPWNKTMFWLVNWCRIILQEYKHSMYSDKTNWCYHPNIPSLTNPHVTYIINIKMIWSVWTKTRKQNSQFPYDNSEKQKNLKDLRWSFCQQTMIKGGPTDQAMSSIVQHLRDEHPSLVALFQWITDLL